MEVLAEFSGEVVSIVVQAEKGRAVVCTDHADAVVFDVVGGRLVIQGESTAFVRSVLNDQRADGWTEVQAELVGDVLYLAIEAFSLPKGGNRALLALDLATKTVQELWRDPDGIFPGSLCPPVRVGDRFVLLAPDVDGVTQIVVFPTSGEERRTILQLELEDGEAGEELHPVARHLMVSPDARQLFLVTQDPDNCDGNRILSLMLSEEEGKVTGAPETLLFVEQVPYAPVIGGSCINPHNGEVACLMYASEWEKFVSISRLPEEGDPLAAADLYLVRPGSPPRRQDVCGRLGLNIAFYDREADAPNLPHNFRVQWDFAAAGHEITPLIALGPNIYLVGLWRGTLLAVHTDTGEDKIVEQFDCGITALKAGPVEDTVLVGLANGQLCTVPISRTT